MNESCQDVLLGENNHLQTLGLETNKIYIKKYKKIHFSLGVGLTGLEGFFLLIYSLPPIYFYFLTQFF